MGWILYLIGAISGLKIVGIVLLSLGAGISFMIIVNDLVEENQIGDTWKKFLSLIIIGTSLLVFLPSKNTMYTMLGLKLGKEVVESESVSSVLEKTYKIIDNKLDSILEDQQGEK